MAYRNAVLGADPHLPPYSRDHLVPFWTEVELSVGDLTDTDITALFTFPEIAWIENRASAVTLNILDDLDTGATDLDLNFNVVETATGVEVYRLATTTAAASTEVLIPMVAIAISEEGWLDVGGRSLAVEVETAAGTAAAGTVQVFGVFAGGVKKYALVDGT